MKSRIASITASFERLSGREQLTAILLIFLLSGLVVGLGSYFVNKDLSRRDARIAAKLTKLDNLAKLRNDYQRRLADQNRLASEIRRNNDPRLLSYIEEISKQSSITLKNAAERNSGDSGGGVLKEVAAEVQVENVSIDRLYDFLKRLEEGNRLVKVRKLVVETRFDNKKRLNAKVTVGTFKTSEAG